MSTRHALQKLSTLLSQDYQAWPAPNLAKVTTRIAQRASFLRPPVQEVDYTKLHARFIQATETGQWEGFTANDWNDSTFILWTKMPSLASLTKFQINYRRHLETSLTARPLKRLIYAYFVSFDPHREGMGWAGNLLRKIIVQQRYPLLDYWWVIDSTYELFAPTLGPLRIAKACLHHPASWEIPWQEIALTGDLADCSFVKHAYRASCRYLSEQSGDLMVQPSPWHNFLMWTRGSATFLRFPTERAAILATLLQPRELAPEIAKLLANFLRGYLEGWHQGDLSCLALTPTETTRAHEIIALAS
jgi:hypothetical protein